MKVLAILAAAAISQLTTLAIAQEDAPGVEWIQVPATTREVDELARASGMGADVATSAKTLVQSMQEALARETRRLRRENERLGLTHDPADQAGLMEAYQKTSDKWQKTHDEVEATFLSDLKSLVPAGADEAWSSFERRRRRRLLLPGSWWAIGQRVDLVQIAEQNKIDQVPEVREVLVGYERDLDRVLIAREPLQKAYMKEAMVARENPDQAAMAKQYEAMRDAECSLIHVERDYTRKLIAAAPEDKRAALRDLFLEAQQAYTPLHPPVRERAERLIKTGRLDGERAAKLKAAVSTFDTRTREQAQKDMDDWADRWCALTYEQATSGQDGGATQISTEESRKLQVDLYRVLDSVATDDDLDVVDKQMEAEEAAKAAAEEAARAAPGIGG